MNRECINTDLLSNISEVAPKLVAEWTSDEEHRKEDAHLFVTYLEIAREKKLIERQLDHIRSGGKEEELS